MPDGAPVFDAPGPVALGPETAQPQLRLLIADRCNLRCSYCHFHATKTDRDKMAPETAEARIAEFARAMQTRGHDAADLSLYGGEPLVNPATVRAALDAAAAESERGFAFSIVLNSNGTLITDTWAREFAARDVDVHVSLDGPDAAANAERVYVNRDSWPDVMRGLDALRRAGCRTQINTVLTPTNADRLEELIDLVAGMGVRRIFIALPDGVFTAEHVPWAALRLGEARAWAESRRVAFFGPWAVSTRPPRPPLDWPPRNLVVRPPGALFFPYLPWREFASVETALATADTAPEWAAKAHGCESCPLEARCRGYLKMMVSYHTGGTGAADLECAVANAVADRLAADDGEPILQTTLDLRFGTRPDGGWWIANALIPESVRDVSGDTLALLDWFAAGRPRSAAERLFEAGNLDAAIESLIACGVLAAPTKDTDARLLEALASPETLRTGVQFRLAASAAPDTDRMIRLLPLLERALSRLPPRLKVDHAPMCVLGVPDGAALAGLVGGEHGPPGWMIGTVFHSIVVLDLDGCEAILAAGGRNRTESLERGLAHELAHLALRKAGLHLPIWLEEGLCEHLSKAAADPIRLRSALAERAAFADFARSATAWSDGRTPWTNLLAFSDEPIEDNPGYLLARDLVHFIERVLGPDALLDALRARGIAAASKPFPLVPGGEGLAAAGLDDVLAAWSEDLSQRLGDAAGFEAPLRVLAGDGRALVYNRMVGSYLLLRSADGADRLTGRNLEFDDVEPLLDSDQRSGATWRHWRRGVFPTRRGRHLRLALEQGCNMGCSYCYETDKQMHPMSVEVADRAVATWRDMLRPEDLGRSTIRFFGGEPLLNWPVMAHVLATGERGLAPGDIGWVVNTNGTRLTPEHVAAFSAKRNRLEVSLSCDGVGIDHDSVRLLRGGQPTFDLVDRAMRMLAEAKIPLAVAVVIGPHNKAGLRRLAEHVLALRRRYDAPIRLALEPLIGGELDAAEEESLAHAHGDVAAFCQAEGLPVTGKMFYGFEAMRDIAGASGHFCSVTGSELSVGPGGELLVCHAIDKSAFGHLDALQAPTDIPLPDIYAERSAGNLPGCRGCAVEGLCGGGCMAQAIKTTGRPDGTPGGAFCDLMRGTFEHLGRELLSRRDT